MKAAVLILLALLASCGGGGDEPEAHSAVPVQELRK